MYSKFPAVVNSRRVFTDWSVVTVSWEAVNHDTNLVPSHDSCQHRVTEPH